MSAKAAEGATVRRAASAPAPAPAPAAEARGGGDQSRRARPASPGEGAVEPPPAVVPPPPSSHPKLVRNPSSRRLWDRFQARLGEEGCTFEELDPDSDWKRVLEELRFSALESSRLLGIIKAEKKSSSGTTSSHGRTNPARASGTANVSAANIAAEEPREVCKRGAEDSKGSELKPQPSRIRDKLPNASRETTSPEFPVGFPEPPDVGELCMALFLIGTLVILANCGEIAASIGFESFQVYLMRRASQFLVCFVTLRHLRYAIVALVQAGRKNVSFVALIAWSIQAFLFTDGTLRRLSECS